METLDLVLALAWAAIISSSFTTGTAVSKFNSVTLRFGFPLGGGTPGGFGVSILADNAGVPGTQLFPLTGSATPVMGLGTYSFGGTTNLNPTTTYWVTLSDTGDNEYEPESADDTLETSGFGWTIGNTIVDPTGATVNPTTPFVMSINATVVPEPSAFAYLGLVGLGCLTCAVKRRSLKDLKR